MRLSPGILCVGILAIPASVFAQDTGTAAAITDAVGAFATAWNAGDGAALSAMYTDDAVLMPPGSEPVRGHDAIVAFLQSETASGAQVELKAGDVEDFGGTAIEILGSYVITGAGGAHVDHGKYVVVWKKVDGSWKLYRKVWNSSMTR